MQGPEISPAPAHRPFIVDVPRSHVPPGCSDPGRACARMLERYSAIVDNLQDVVYQTDASGHWTFLNPAWTELTGYSVEESLGTHYLGYLHPEDHEYSRAQSRPFAERRETYCRYEVRYRQKDGSVRWVEVTARLILGAGGEMEGTAGTLTDITARREAEAEVRRVYAELEHRVSERTEQLTAANLALRDSEERFRSAFNNAPIGMGLISPEGRWIRVNRALCRMLGYTESHLLSTDFQTLTHADDLEMSVAHVRGLLAGEYPAYQVEKRYLHADGHSVWVLADVSVIRALDGAPFMIVAQIQDITQRRLAAEALERYRILAEHSRDIMLFITETGRILSANQAACQAYGYSIDELQQMTVHQLRAPETLDAVPDQLARMAVGYHHFESVHIRRDGSRFPVEVSAESAIIGSQHVNLSVVRDITERQTLERQLRQQALHDPLTSLPNRTLFRDRLEHALERSARGERRTAVLYLDVDRFKLVNDSLGHYAGDALLVAMAGRIQGCLRSGDTAARLGGDEFAVLLEDVADEEAAGRLAERLLQALAPPFEIDGRPVYAGASIGVAVDTRRGSTADDLLRHADLAMYQAKSVGRGRYALFQNSMSLEASDRLRLETELRQAPERNEFRVFYQPVVSVASGRAIGAEALVRWQHPREGLLGPDRFIPIQEQIGLIRALTTWVLRAAQEQCAAWHAAGYPLAVSVNLSAANIGEPGFVDDVARLVNNVALPPQWLKLEVTESAVMTSPAHAIQNLHRLRDLGVRLSLDDFGTGYSSLSYLKQLPVHEVKIDKSFVLGMHEREDGPIVGGIIDLVHRLGKTVVAEGVEHEDVWNLLRVLGCDAAQGFLMSRPLPADDFRDWLRRSPWGADPARTQSAASRPHP